MAFVFVAAVAAIVASAAVVVVCLYMSRDKGE